MTKGALEPEQMLDQIVLLLLRKVEFEELVVVVDGLALTRRGSNKPLPTGWARVRTYWTKVQWAECADGIPAD